VLDWRVPGYRGIRDLRQGTVLARHEASGHPVLLRYHPPAPEPVVTARRTEAHTLASLASPHIAQFYEHIEVALPPRIGPADPGGPPDRIPGADHAEAAVGAVTVREYVAGASVRSLLSRSVLPPESALSLLDSGLLALRYAHERGLTHRGYKPENLLVDADGTARLADFAVRPEAEESGTSADSDSRPRSWILADVKAAFAVFVTCLGGQGDRLPRRLRGLAAAGEAGDGAALLEAVEQVGRAGWGAQWRSRGERELARRVARARPSRPSDKTRSQADGSVG
jgi:eukaryotic-like serine/threonine-protein kinase